MSFAILGQGTAVPPGSMTQSEGQEITRALSCHAWEQATWLQSMYTNTGIERRHLALGRAVIDDILHGTRQSQSCFLPSGADDDLGPTTGQRMRLYEDWAGPLALEASREALEQSKVAAQAVTHLVTVSCTGFSAPGVDIQLIQGLGLSPGTQRTHVGYMGCHGALNGLRVARAFTGSEPRARVLLCAVELCGLHYHYQWDPQKVIANALFADGAAAVVGVPAPCAPKDAWQLAASGSCVFPDSTAAMSWRITDNGFAMTLSRKVPGLIAEYLRSWMEDWLGQHELTVAAVGSWAVHPGGPKILDAVEEALALPAMKTEIARQVFAAHGNMSSPTVLFILDRLREVEAPRPCVALGFGPGLTLEAALFR